MPILKAIIDSDAGLRDLKPAKKALELYVGAEVSSRLRLWWRRLTGLGYPGCVIRSSTHVADG